MSDHPHNAGQTVTVPQISKMPFMDIDWGPITVTENWGRLFIRDRESMIVVLRQSYPALIAALQHFVAPASPTPVAAAMAVPDMPETDVGDVGNYYGGLAIMAKDGVTYWSIGNHDGHHWLPCPLPVFAALASMKGKTP